MNAWKTLKTHAKSGTSLVEMVAALLIFSILMTMIVAVIHPASKIFVQMQRLQYAQVILDNTMQELRGTALEASGNGYVKIYGACSPDTDLTREEGAETGAALEFVNSEGYAVLLSADGCPETDIFLGSAAVGTVSKDQIPSAMPAEPTAIRTKTGKKRPVPSMQSLRTATIWVLIWNWNFPIPARRTAPERKQTAASQNFTAASTRISGFTAIRSGPGWKPGKVQSWTSGFP